MLRVWGGPSTGEPKGDAEVSGAIPLPTTPCPDEETVVQRGEVTPLKSHSSTRVGPVHRAQGPGLGEEA